MRLNDDIRDLWAEFERSEVEFVLVGGWAVTLHARPRTTKDVDLVDQMEEWWVAVTARRTVAWTAECSVGERVAWWVVPQAVSSWTLSDDRKADKKAKTAAQHLLLQALVELAKLPEATPALHHSSNPREWRGR
jgi:hypothetical protein